MDKIAQKQKFERKFGIDYIHEEKGDGTDIVDVIV